MAGRKSRRLRASTRRPLSIMRALRAPESWPFDVRCEISQGIARRRVGNLYVDQKEKISAPGDAARFQRRPRRSPLLSKATALQALRQLVLPLKERRMQSAVGRSGRGVLCDLRIF